MNKEKGISCELNRRKKERKKVQSEESGKRK